VQQPPYKYFKSDFSEVLLVMRKLTFENKFGSCISMCLCVCVCVCERQGEGGKEGGTEG
jgi:hypothetical protein